MEGTQKPHLVPSDSCAGTAVTSPEGLEVQVVLGCVCASLESKSTHRPLVSTPGVSDMVFVGWSLRSCISDRSWGFRCGPGTTS